MQISSCQVKNFANPRQYNLSHGNVFVSKRGSCVNTETAKKWKRNSSGTSIIFADSDLIKVGNSTRIGQRLDFSSTRKIKFGGGLIPSEFGDTICEKIFLHFF